MKKLFLIISIIILGCLSTPFPLTTFAQIEDYYKPGKYIIEPPIEEILIETEHIDLNESSRGIVFDMSMIVLPLLSLMILVLFLKHEQKSRV